MEGVNLTVNGINTIGGGDIAHQHLTFTINVTNQGSEMAKDVKLFFDTATTGQGMQTFEGTPDHQPINLAPGQSANFTASWEVDLTTMGKQWLVELMRQDVVRAGWTGADGASKEKVLMRGGMPAFT